MIFVKSLKLLVTLVLVVECVQTCSLSLSKDGKIQRCSDEWICGDIKCPLDSDRCFIAATNEEEASLLARVNICISKRNTILSIKTSLTPTDPQYQIRRYSLLSSEESLASVHSADEARLFKEDIKRSIQEALSNVRKTGKDVKYDPQGNVNHNGGHMESIARPTINIDEKMVNTEEIQKRERKAELAKLKKELKKAKAEKRRVNKHFDREIKNIKRNRHNLAENIFNDKLKEKETERSTQTDRLQKTIEDTQTRIDNFKVSEEKTLSNANNDYKTSIPNSRNDLSKLESQSANATPVAIQPCLVYPNPHIEIVKCEDKWICGDIECPQESDRCSLAVTNQIHRSMVQIDIACISKENVALKKSSSQKRVNPNRIISFYFNAYRNGGHKSSTSSIIHIDEKMFNIEKRNNLEKAVVNLKTELTRLQEEKEKQNKIFDSAIENIKRKQYNFDKDSYENLLNNMERTRSNVIHTLEGNMGHIQKLIKDTEESIRNIN